MVPARNTTAKILFTLALVLTCSFFVTPDLAIGQTANIAPARLNLTSSGAAEDIQAIIRMPIEDGYTLSGFDVQLMFGDVWLADAYSFTYCDYDRAFIASFDKGIVADNPALLEVAGERIKLTVEGQYLAVDAEDNSTTYSFSCSGYIWIIASRN